MNDPDVQRLETERLKPSPKERTSSPEDTLRQLIHVLACALGVGRWPA